MEIPRAYVDGKEKTNGKNDVHDDDQEEQDLQ